MLDVQRQRGLTYRYEVSFTRKVMWCHMITGAIIIAMLLFHELFWWLGGAILWYATSIFIMFGYMNELNWCRLVLAGHFALIALAGLFFINIIYPNLSPISAPLIPHYFMPIWVGFSNMLYGFASVLMLMSDKIRKAGTVGFTLW